MATISRGRRLSSAEKGEPQNKISVDNGIYKGYVKDISDAQKMGRIKVWIPSFGSLEENPAGWRLIRMTSPFAGASPLTGLGKDINDSDQTQISYGMWFAPPDIGNEVLVCFVNGDPTQGHMLGYLYQQNMNSMVPSEQIETNYRTDDTKLTKTHPNLELPTLEYNKYSPLNNSGDPRRPINMVRMQGLAKQGLIKDRIRGIYNSSSRRSSISEVYGIKTPGPKNPKSYRSEGRKGGHSFVMDDNPDNEHISLRTRSGAQLRIDETNDMIYLINSSGTAWFQIDSEGNGDIFCKNDWSVRALNNINFIAENNINIEAGNNILFKAAKRKSSGGTVSIEANDSLNLNIANDVNLMGKSFLVSVDDIDMSGNKSVNLESKTDLNLLAGMNANLGGILTASVSGGASVSVDGASFNINTGASIKPTPAKTANIKELSVNSKVDNLPEFTDEYNIDRKTKSMTTIASRMPTLEPCPDHTAK